MTINFYGRKNTEVNTFEPSQPTEAEKIKYRRFRILTNSAFALMLFALFQSALLLCFRLLFVDEVYTKVFAFCLVVAIIIIGITICVKYKYLNHYFSYSNFGVIIGFELIFIVFQLIMYNFSAPFLFYILMALSFCFIIYILRNLECTMKYKVWFSLIPIFLLIITNFIYLNTLEFTPRYIYLSDMGYFNKTNDESNFYYDLPVRAKFDDYDALDEVSLLTNTMSNTMEGVFSTENFKHLNQVFELFFSADEVINFNNKYDADFFKENCLYFSIIELENKDDIVKLSGIQHSLRYTRPIIEYTKSTTNDSNNGKAVCLMVLEFSLEEYEKKFDHIAGFTVDKAKITYK